MTDGRKTEKKFVDFCNKQGYYKLRLQVDSGRGFGVSNAMPADYLVITKKTTFFVEVKEVDRKDNKFVFSRLRQQSKLTKIHQIENSNVRACVFIYYTNLKKVVFLFIEDYNRLYLNSKNKSFISYEDIPSEYKVDLDMFRLI